MPSFSRHEVVLVRYPFTDLSGDKVRPAVVVNAEHPSNDVIVVALTSRLERLLPGEFRLREYRGAGLNVPSVVKRGLFTVHDSLIVRSVGSLKEEDRETLNKSLREWLGL